MAAGLYVFSSVLRQRAQFPLVEGLRNTGHKTKVAICYMDENRDWHYTYCLRGLCSPSSSVRSNTFLFNKIHMDCLILLT